MEDTTSKQEDDSAQLRNAKRLVYFAAERTLMAWIRSALGLMALGFVVDRFGLVLRNITPIVVNVKHTKSLSFWGGSMLVTVGAVMALVAAIRYWLFAYEYRHNNATITGHGIMLGVVFTLIIALLGFVITGYLLLTLVST